MNQELLQRVRVLDPVGQTDGVMDVLWENDRLVTLAPTVDPVPDTALVHPCDGWILGPSLVDLYSHGGEPGFEERETWQSLAQAAAVGGFSDVVVLPTTEPTFDQSGLVAQVPSDLPVNLMVWGALTQGCRGEAMTELYELAAAGCVGFSNDRPLQDWSLLRHLLDYLKPLQKPIALWPMDPHLGGGGAAREGTLALQFGIPCVSVLAETIPLSAIIEAVAVTGTPVHLMRLSTARGVELVAQAKAAGLPITASTTWMHLLWHTGHLSAYNTALRLDPPLGNPTDQAALIQGIKDGTIDAIAVDHSPYTYEEKNVGFDGSPPGAIGLELALPLLWDRFVRWGDWPALLLWDKLSIGPRRCLHWPIASITPGSSLPLTLFNPQQTWTAEIGQLKSRSHNTPYLGQRILGRVDKVYGRRAV